MRAEGSGFGGRGEDRLDLLSSEDDEELGDVDRREPLVVLEWEEESESARVCV